MNSLDWIDEPQPVQKEAKGTTPLMAWLLELGITKFPADAATRIRRYLGNDLGDREWEILKEIVRDGWAEIEEMTANSKTAGYSANPFDSLFPTTHKKKDGSPCNWPIVRWAASAKHQGEFSERKAENAVVLSAVARMTPDAIIKHLPHLCRIKNAFQSGTPDYVKAENEWHTFMAAFDIELKRRIDAKDTDWVYQLDKAGRAAGDNWKRWFGHRLYAIGRERILSKTRLAEFQSGR